MGATYDVVWSRSPRRVRPQRAATRLAPLNGKKIAWGIDHPPASDPVCKL